MIIKATFDVELRGRLFELLQPLLLSVAHVPDADLHLIAVEEPAFSVLFAFAPGTDVQLAILPPVGSLPVKHIVLELSLVLLALRPRELPESVHFVLLPLALVYLAVGPGIGAAALDDAVVEVAVVRRAVGELQEARAIFPVVFVVPFEHGAVGPILHAFPVLLPVLPHAFVAVPGAASAGGHLLKGRHPVRPALVELSEQYVAIRLQKPPLAFRKILRPAAFINGAIGPSLLAVAVLHIANPLARILFICFRADEQGPGLPPESLTVDRHRLTFHIVPLRITDVPFLTRFAAVVILIIKHSIQLFLHLPRVLRLIIKFAVLVNNEFVYFGILELLLLEAAAIGLT